MPSEEPPQWRLLAPLQPAVRSAVLAAAARRSFDRGVTLFSEGGRIEVRDREALRRAAR